MRGCLLVGTEAPTCPALLSQEPRAGACGVVVARCPRGEAVQYTWYGNQRSVCELSLILTVWCICLCSATGIAFPDWASCPTKAGRVPRMMAQPTAGRVDGACLTITPAHSSSHDHFGVVLFCNSKYCIWPFGHRVNRFSSFSSVPSKSNWEPFSARSCHGIEPRRRPRID